MRRMMSVTLVVLLAACGGGGGNASGDKTTTGLPGVEGEDRQVLVDLKRSACIGRMDALIEYDRAQAERGCNCAIDRLIEGKSADELMASMGDNAQRDLEDRTARECLGQAK